jgi:hypothetical protein
VGFVDNALPVSARVRLRVWGSCLSIRWHIVESRCSRACLCGGRGSCWRRCRAGLRVRSRGSPPVRTPGFPPHPSPRLEPGTNSPVDHLPLAYNRLVLDHRVLESADALLKARATRLSHSVSSGRSLLCVRVPITLGFALVAVLPFDAANNAILIL